MKLVDGHEVIERAEVNGEDREFIHILTDYIEDADEVKLRQGEWIMSDIQCKEDTDNGNYQYICSVCGRGDIHARTQEVPYCWWCGARMKGVDDEVLRQL